MNLLRGSKNVKRENLTRLTHLLAVSCLWAAMPASAKENADWKTYRFDTKDTFACAFIPDSRYVAVLYKSFRSTEQKFVRVYSIHLAAWDFKAGKVEEKRRWDSTLDIREEQSPLRPRYIEYTTDGRHLVILDAGVIRVLDAATYADVKSIAFEEPKGFEDPKGLDVVYHTGSGFSLTPDGSRAAVAFSSSAGEGGVVRVYDLRNGEIVREWRLRDGVLHVAGVALSPDGKRIAVSTLPVTWSTAPEAFTTDNVRVMDVSSGETLVGVNTKYLAGSVLFGPEDTLLTASIAFNRTDPVKIWDARTGKLLREIANPGAGVHYRLDLSADGELLLGFTGTEKTKENFVVFDSQRFAIWDFATGRKVAASPNFPPTDRVRMYGLELGGEQPVIAAQLQLSPDKRFVVAWWHLRNKPLVYEILEH